MFRNCSQLDKHNSKENNDIPQDKSRCNAPPDWLKTTMARIVPSLQLAQTEPLLHLTPYTYTFKGRSRIFLHKQFFARHYSLPPRQPSIFARLARWQSVTGSYLNIKLIIYIVNIQITILGLISKNFYFMQSIFFSCHTYFIHVH